MDKTKALTKSCIDGYEYEAWADQLGSIPVDRIEHHDRSESYEMDRASVFELENGKYALVTENGCSCYSSSDALIEIFPTKSKAVKAFGQWLGQKNG